MDYITNGTVLTTENQRKMIFSLKKAFPSLDCRLIGHSLCSRGIFSLGIGRSSDPLLIAAGFHGQEWLTCLAALRFAELLLRSRAAGKKLFGIDTRCITREVIIVPCVNPDGVQIAINGCDGAGRYSAEVSRICAASDEKWNANARGVDINHNCDAGWDILRELEIDSGILGPAPRRRTPPGRHPRPRTAQAHAARPASSAASGQSQRFSASGFSLRFSPCFCWLFRLSFRLSFLALFWEFLLTVFTSFSGNSMRMPQPPYTKE